MNQNPATSGPARVDATMQLASEALVKRRYFETERLCLEALAQALGGNDYERAARICLPLQEARRLKRQLAIDSGHIEVVTDPVLEGFNPRPGCYVLCPPRVGAEARSIRAVADLAEVPVVIVAREPTTQSGRCPIVAVGPITIRALVDEPEPVKARAAKPRKVKAPVKEPPARAAPVRVFGPYATPTLEWILAAGEALGDAAIAQCLSPLAVDRVDELYTRMQSCPDHEKLHQRLVEACLQAAREPKAVKPTPRKLDDEIDEHEGDEP